MTEDNSIRALLQELLTEVQRLFRQEIQLARAETQEKIGQVQYGAIHIAAGMGLAFAALLIILQAIVVGLSNFMAPWVASLIVGVVVAIIALILVMAGQSRLKAANLMPNRTIKSIRRDSDLVVEKAR